MECYLPDEAFTVLHYSTCRLNIVKQCNPMTYDSLMIIHIDVKEHTGTISSAYGKKTYKDVSYNRVAGTKMLSYTALHDKAEIKLKVAKL